MKIAILTHPLRVNYGGLLQAYALKKILERQGHEVSHLQLKIYQYKYRTLFSQSKALIKYIIHIVKGTPRDIHTFLPLSKKEINFIRKETNSFIKRYLNPQYHTNFTNNLNYKYDIFIVGSDQVWRPGFTPNIYNYFLDFVDDKHKKIAYAASMGIDYWPYTSKQTSIIKGLIQKFNFVSVRENSAKKLFKEYLSFEFPIVSDPTMLLTPQDYKSLFNSKSDYKQDYIAIYLLNSETERHFVSNYEENLEIQILMPKNRENVRTNQISNDDKYISVEEWLKKIYYAKYVVTDSFHGTVFSILFNKQFIVIPHSLGGNSRIETLLNMFNLGTRFKDLEDVSNNFSRLFNNIIHYETINKQIEHLRNSSLKYLLNAIAS